MSDPMDNAVCVISDCVDEIKKLKKINEKLVEALENAKRIHVEVDGDCFFSCPKADNYCGISSSGNCDCGADEHNLKIEEVLKEVEGK